MLYNVLVSPYSKVSQLYVHIYPLLFGSPSHLSHHRALSRVPCAIQSVLISYLVYTWYHPFGLPCGSDSKESACNEETWFWSLDWEEPLKRAWQPTPVFLPGEPHGQRSLAGDSPWDRQESDTTEWLSMHTHSKFMYINPKRAIIVHHHGDTPKWLLLCPLIKLWNDTMKYSSQRLRQLSQVQLLKRGRTRIQIQVQLTPTSCSLPQTFSRKPVLP